jgi:hypothetical protein
MTDGNACVIVRTWCGPLSWFHAACTGSARSHQGFAAADTFNE